jgi:hypothetical protein
MIKYKSNTLLIFSIAIAFTIYTIGCASDRASGEFYETDDYVEYENAPDDSVIITGEADYVGSSEALHEDAKIVIDGEALDTAEGKFCSEPDAKMDVIVVDGEVVEVICYPPPTEENMTTVEQGQGDTEVPQNANNTVIVFDPSTDGEVIEGDISVDGNNVAIYGNGSDKTIIEGDLIISGNNARVRGLYIKGDVVLDLNNTALLFCVVEGNVEIRKNNVTVAATEVYGNMTVLGNNAVLVQNGVQGDWDIVGYEQLCDGNYAFDDANSDFVIADDEIGDPLTCQTQEYGETERKDDPPISA